MTINPSLYKNLPFNALRDLTGVSMFAQSANLLAVNPSLPAKNVKELIALAQSKPGKLTFSSSGIGSSQHLTGELFNLRAKVNTLHVAYKGTAPSLTAAAQRRGGHELHQHPRRAAAHQVGTAARHRQHRATSAPSSCPTCRR